MCVNNIMKELTCKMTPPTTLPAAERIVAIGDIHGDFDLLKKSLMMAKVINHRDEWIAAEGTIVVQVGDQIDSCRNIHDCHFNRQSDDSSDDVEILLYINRLHEKAKLKKGGFYSVLGNHEIMNVQGRMDYVSYDNYYNFYYKDPQTGKEYFGERGRIDAFKRGGSLAKLLACTRNSVMVVGSFIFVHAAVLPSLLNYMEINRQKTGFSAMEDLNEIIREWLLSEVDKYDPYEITNLLDDPSLSPFWPRFLGAIPPNRSMKNNYCTEYVKPVIETLKIGSLVIGHTPQIAQVTNGINGTCFYNKGNHLTAGVLRVDGGFSKAFKLSNKIQVIEILKDEKVRIITKK